VIIPEKDYGLLLMKLHALPDVVSSDSSFTCPTVPFIIRKTLLDVALTPVLTDGELPLN